VKKVVPLTPSQQRAVEVMQHARQLVQTDLIGRRVWLEVFTDADRKRWHGDYAKACPSADVIAMWTRARRGSEYRAIVDIAVAVGIMTPDRREWLLKEAGEEAATTPADRPHWDRDACRLYLGQKVIREVRGLKVSRSIVSILDAFEFARWPTSIDDPMPKATAKDPQSLRHAVASLNGNLTGIRFFGNGSGGVRWAFHPASSDG
jgi:hypothetical protein